MRGAGMSSDAEMSASASHEAERSTGGSGRGDAAEQGDGASERQGRGPRPLPRVPDGRGRGAPRAVRPHPRPDREAAPAGPGSMLKLDGRAGGEPAVEMRPECVLGVPKSSRKSLGEVPEAHGQIAEIRGR